MDSEMFPILLSLIQLVPDLYSPESEPKEAMNLRTT